MKDDNYLERPNRKLPANQVQHVQQFFRKREVMNEKEQSVKLMIDTAAAAELENLRKKHKVH